MNFYFEICIFLKDALAKEKSWLEDIKNAKGNTEVNSLKQADCINKSGIYHFGLIQNSQNLVNERLF